jgi:hypothetical protein
LNAAHANTCGVTDGARNLLNGLFSSGLSTSTIGNVNSKRRLSKVQLQTLERLEMQPVGHHGDDVDEGFLLALFLFFQGCLKLRCATAAHAKSKHLPLRES